MMKSGSNIRLHASLVPFMGASLLLTGMFVADGLANPHTTIGAKNTPNHFATRDELEGTGGILGNVRISHGCNGQTVKAMSLVLPNGVDSVATDKATSAEVDLVEHLTGPVIRMTPVQDKDVFRKTRAKEGVVNNVGSGATEGIRAIHYKDGLLEEGSIGRIPFDAAFPRFNENSCAASVQVNIAIANYCTRSHKDEDRADIWIGHFTQLFDDPAVVVQSPPGFWPQLRVVRDLENNPLPAGCPADGIHLAVSPASHEIDRYLPIRGYWPSKRGGRDFKPKKHWPKR